MLLSLKAMCGTTAYHNFPTKMARKWYKMAVNPSFLDKVTSFKNTYWVYCKPQVQDGPSNNRNPRLVAVGLSSSAGLHWKTFTSCSCSSTLILRGESSKSWPCWLEGNNKETLFPLFFAGTQEPYLDHINCNWQPDSLEPSYTLLGWCQPSGSRKPLSKWIKTWNRRYLSNCPYVSV